MPVKYVKDFDFSRECGFTGSAMRQGGPVRKAEGGGRYKSGSAASAYADSGAIFDDMPSKVADQSGGVGNLSGAQAARYQASKRAQTSALENLMEGEGILAAKLGRRDTDPEDAGRYPGFAAGGPVAGVQSPASVVAPGPAPAPSASPLSRATITMPVGDAAKAAVGMVQAGKQLGARQTMGGLARATNAVRARQGMDPRMPSPAAGLAPAAAAPGQVPQARVPGLKKGGRFGKKPC